MSFEPDDAANIYSNMVDKRTSMHSKSSRNSILSTTGSINSTKSSSSSKSGSAPSKLTSIFSSNSHDPKERKMMPDGTKLGRMIDGIQYVKGSREEKLAQARWVQRELEKAGIM